MVDAKTATRRSLQIIVIRVISKDLKSVSVNGHIEEKMDLRDISWEARCFEQCPDPIPVPVHGRVSIYNY